MEVDATLTASTAATPRLAATTILGRDVAGGPPEILLVRRHRRSGFAASAWVFPGGVLDARDGELDAARWHGIDPDALAPRFRLNPRDVLAMHVAAVRETFEEAGLLLAQRREGGAVDVLDPRVVEVRRAMMQRGSDVDFGAFLAEHDLVLDLGRLTYWARWLTPFAEPRRYDTCFFLARAPADQQAAHDAIETVDLRWTTAQAALEADDLPVIYPTQRTLEELAPHARLEDLLAVAEARGEVRSVQPHVVVEDGRFVGILHPDEPGYPHDLYASAP